MKPIALAGVVIALLGLLILGYEFLLRDDAGTVVETGALRVEEQRDHTIPTVAAVLAIVAGVGLAFAGQRRL